jgi:hypothetical protein
MKAKHAAALREGVTAARTDLRIMTRRHQYLTAALARRLAVQGTQRVVFGLAGRAYKEYLQNHWRTIAAYNIDVMTEGNLVRMAYRHDALQMGPYRADW